jgi:hypothetical protein
MSLNLPFTRRRISRREGTVNEDKSAIYPDLAEPNLTLDTKVPYPLHDLVDAPPVTIWG